MVSRLDPRIRPQSRVLLMVQGHTALGTVTRIISRKGMTSGTVEVRRDSGFLGFETGNSLSFLR